ncbi:MurR/RpiR family transcriptional regulator [Paenibacillus medicaginis]|uniref:MurR/RpiR family transcriptional regulator n=1 Tax=Paenibacillus medicaginis TaxID=1470560 RepID=A0ABV5C6D1_9BACL
MLQKLIKMDNMSDSERAIAQYMIDNKEKVLHMTIHQLARETYSSNPTIIRLCRKLGVDGFRQFKIVLSSELERHYDELYPVDVNMPFREKESSMDIARRIRELSQQTLLDSSSMLTEKKLNEAASILEASRQAYLFAVGDSMIRAASFQNKLLKINRPVQLSNFLNEQGYHAFNASKEDCAVFITYHGGHADFIEYATLMRDKGVKQIVITSETEGRLAKRCDVVLPLPVSETNASKIATFSSQVAIDYVLNVLYSCVFERQYDKNLKFKNNSDHYVKRISSSRS